MKELEKWITEDEINSLYSSDYWNDVNEEKSKDWYIENASDDSVVKHLNKSGLKEEFEMVLSQCIIKGKVLDLASGVCWTSAIVSKINSVDSVDSVEFSFHRINDLAPIVIESLDGNKNKINRILGSFYDIKRENEYYDTIILSSAYHHAEFPLKLFHECNRVLKKGGTILIVGENIIGYKRIFGRLIKNLLKLKLKFHIFSEYYNQIDDPLGDHYYMECDYRFTFAAYGYSCKSIKSNIRNSIGFVGVKKKL